MLDKRVSPCAPVHSIGQVPQVVLLVFELSDARLIWNFRASLDELRTKHDVLLANLGILKLVLCNGKRACSMIPDDRRFFLNKIDASKGAVINRCIEDGEARRVWRFAKVE